MESVHNLKKAGVQVYFYQWNNHVLALFHQLILFLDRQLQRLGPFLG